MKMLKEMTRRKLELYLDGKIVGNNILMRMHWTIRRDLIRDWGWLISSKKFRSEQLPIKALFENKVRCDVVRYFSGKAKEMDDANLIGGIDKLIIDNLVKQKVLANDSPDCFCWGKIKQERADRDGVKIMLEETN